MFCKRLSPRHTDRPAKHSATVFPNHRAMDKKKGKEKSSSSFWLYLCSSYRNSRHPTPDDAETRVSAQKKDNKYAPPGYELSIVRLIIWIASLGHWGSLANLAGKESIFQGKDQQRWGNNRAKCSLNESLKVIREEYRQIEVKRTVSTVKRLLRSQILSMDSNL